MHLRKYLVMQVPLTAAVSELCGSLSLSLSLCLAVSARCSIVCPSLPLSCCMADALHSAPSASQRADRFLTYRLITPSLAQSVAFLL